MDLLVLDDIFRGDLLPPSRLLARDCSNSGWQRRSFSKAHEPLAQLPVSILASTASNTIKASLPHTQPIEIPLHRCGERFCSYHLHKWNLLHDILLRANVALLSIYRPVPSYRTAIWIDIPPIWSRLCHWLLRIWCICVAPPSLYLWLTEFPGKVMTRDYKVTAKAAGVIVDRSAGDDLSKLHIEAARLRSAWWVIGAALVCILVYGWTLHTKIVRKPSLIPVCQNFLSY